MEVSYELLWKICSGFLLSFLASGLVSFILYCSNSSHDDFSDRKVVKSSINDGKKKKKRVKFVDQVDDGFVKDIEVEGVSSLLGVEESGEKDEISRGGSGDSVGLVDVSEKGGVFVGFDGGVVERCVVDYMSLGSDVVDYQREKKSTNSSMELGIGENEVDEIVGFDVHVSLGSDELVDDQKEGNLANSGMELSIGENEVDKIMGCDVDVSLGSDELVDDQREGNLANSSIEVGGGENEVDKIVGCDVDVSLGSDELVDDQRDEILVGLSNVYEDEVLDVDRVDGIVGGADDVRLGSGELVDDQRDGNLANSISVYEDERIGRVFVGGENEVDKSAGCNGFEKDGLVYDVGVTLGSDEVVDNDKIVDDHGNVGSKERSSGVFGEEGMLNDEEEWEGIERSDLAKEFARAKGFVENGDKERRLAMAGGNDLMMQLYGLEKVAMEGPCHEPQPLALKFAARVKWNAWQKLGNMSPEEAMEQYISILSQNVPEWIQAHSSDKE